MRVIEVHPLLEAVFDEEAELPSRIDSIEQIRWDHCDVYRIKSEAGGYIAHVTAESSEQLRRTRDNLDRLRPFALAGIPRALAWRDSKGAAGPGREWAILVSTEIAGAELSRHNFNRFVWADLKELLRQIHVMPVQGFESPRTSLPVHEPAAFAGVAEALQGLFGLLRVPLKAGRVRRHLEDMSEYLERNAAGFRVPQAAIHGDLNPSNIVSNGRRAGIVDWAELELGDYAYDLATLKFSLDSIAPKISSELLREQAIEYGAGFDDHTLELRLRFFMALPGLITALSLPSHRSAARAWRARTCFLHSEAQWRQPLRLAGLSVGAPAAPTGHYPWAVRDPLRGLAHVLAARWTT
jgi:aminoglycoside phosphotransferase (APT) family kinase protein